MKGKEELTELEQKVMHEGGTEQAFTGEYWNHNESGVYRCKSCGQILFRSDTKLDSSKGPAGLQGWPAFDTAVSGSVVYQDDITLGTLRTEVACSKCGVHLGHIFPDKETSTEQHYCINSCTLDFEKHDNKN